MRRTSTLKKFNTSMLVLAIAAAGIASPTTAAFAAPTKDPKLISGDDFTIIEGAAGYEVTLNLDEPLPVRDEIPTVYVDGVAIGTARESADGLSLSVTTPSALAATASNVQYAFGDLDSTPGSSTVKSLDVSSQKVLDLDPSSTGDWDVSEFGYDLGSQAIDLKDIGGIKGEFRAQVYLPQGKTTPSPVVVFQHGRHSSCNTPAGTPSNPAGYPCLDTQIEIPSYLGYGTTAEKLASHGYSVVSVSVNAINSNDNQLASDYGATARGQIILDHLDYLTKANAGAIEGVGSQLVGKLDFSRIGLMGHSRGGEGVARAVQLNQGLEKPYAITSVLPLAPVDFSRATTPGVSFLTVLPYCDGDVTSLQGQHMFDDNNELVSDDALRSSLLVMGANHNFFNTTWDPETYQYSASDDWADRNSSVCSKAEDANIRLTGTEQRQVGDSIMAGWFRLTLGGEDQFLPMFDGSNSTIEAYQGADVVATASAPASAKAQIHAFGKVDRNLRTSGAATVAACNTAISCGAEGFGAARIPHWASMRFASAATGAQATQIKWSSPASAVNVDVPAAASDASGFGTLGFQLSPGAGIETTQALMVKLTDVKGKSSTVDIAPHTTGVAPLPAGHANLGKVILRQVAVPLTSFTGVDLSKITTVSLVAGAATGNILVKDLAFQKSSAGTAVAVPQMPVVNVSDAYVNEGNAPGTALVGITMSKTSKTAVSGRFEVFNGSGTATAQKSEGTFTIPAGKLCTVQPVALNGNKTASSTPTTTFSHAITAIAGGITGKGHGKLTVREDDAVITAESIVEDLAEDPGTQVDPCLGLNFEETRTNADAAYDSITEGQNARIIASVSATGNSLSKPTGNLTVSSDAKTLTTKELSSSKGILDIAGLPVGAHSLTVTYGGDALHAPSQSVVELTVVAAPVAVTSTLKLSSAKVSYSIGSKAASITAKVGGIDPAIGIVEFDINGSAHKSVSVKNGSATLTLPTTLPVGSHLIQAKFVASDSTVASSTAKSTFTVSKATPVIKGSIASSSVLVGKSTTVTVNVSATGLTPTGKVTATLGGKSVTGTLKNGKVTLKTPTTLAVGKHALTLKYAGDAKVGAKSVGLGTLKVSKAPATLKTHVAGRSVKAGKSVTITVKVSATGSTPTGRVTATLGGKSVTATLKDGKATLKTPAALKAGKHTLTVKYAGNTKVLAKAASAGSITVKK